MVNFVKRQDQPLFHLASKIPMQKIVYMAISLVIILSIVTIAPQYAQSSNGNTHVILFTKDYSREFTAGQIVHLEGQIIQAQSSSPSGIANANYQIIDTNTGYVIAQGNTDSQGLLFMEWTASSSLPGTSKVDLIVRFAGGGGFDASDSPPLELTISSPVSSTPVITTPSFVYHNTQLTVQVRDGSSPGYIQVNPVLKGDSGSDLTTTEVSISVDGSNVSTISSNQWSRDILVGSGAHNIRADTPPLHSTNDETIIYRSASDSIRYTSPTITTFHDTQLTLQVRDGSSPGYIQVNPDLEYSRNLLSTTVTLSIDGTFNSKIQSNQWSGDIFVGSGTHNIQGYVPQTTDSNNNAIVFRSSYSPTVYYTVAASTTGNTGTGGTTGTTIVPSTTIPTTTNSGPILSSNYDITTIAIAIVMIAIVGSIIGIVMMKRKPKAIKSSHGIGGAFAGAPVSGNPLHTDDTQFYGCPNCGLDITIKYGKQYCDNCRMYL